MDKESIFVTGGRGFIGVNLASHISDNAYYTVYDDLIRSSPTGYEKLENITIKSNILNLDKLKESMKGSDKVVHLAALGSVVESISNSEDNFKNNVQGTFNVLKAAVDVGVRRLVFASTGGALIGEVSPPVDESSIPKPISPYGASKLCGEGYCHAFAKSYGIETVSMRFGNVYGPHSAHKKGAISMFIKAIIKDEPIIIFGDGSASRDYIYVDDLCSGIRAGLDQSLTGGEVFHLASGRETTITELASTLINIAGKPKHPIIHKPSRRGEVTRNFANYDKAKDILNFEPKWNLEEGLEKTWNWFIEQGDDVLDLEGTDS